MCREKPNRHHGTAGRGSSAPMTLNAAIGGMGGCFQFHPWSLNLAPHVPVLSTDQCRSSYQVGFDNSLRITYANGMDTHYQTEPHILAGAANPTVARRNMSLPGESGQNLVEWRFRKEQARGKVIVFGRKLRVGGFYLFIYILFYFGVAHQDLCCLNAKLEY